MWQGVDRELHVAGNMRLMRCCEKYIYLPSITGTNPICLDTDCLQSLKAYGSSPG
jgi:hypothetical protein